jgi:hypothetical protein
MGWHFVRDARILNDSVAMGETGQSLPCFAEAPSAAEGD